MKGRFTPFFGIASQYQDHSLLLVFASHANGIIGVVPFTIIVSPFWYTVIPSSPIRLLNNNVVPDIQEYTPVQEPIFAQVVGELIGVIHGI